MIRVFHDIKIFKIKKFSKLSNSVVEEVSHDLIKFFQVILSEAKTSVLFGVLQFVLPHKTL